MLVFFANLVLTIILITLAQDGIGGDIFKTWLFAGVIVFMCLVNYIDGKDSE